MLTISTDMKTIILTSMAQNAKLSEKVSNLPVSTGYRTATESLHKLWMEGTQE